MRNFPKIIFAFLLLLLSSFNCRRKGTSSLPLIDIEANMKKMEIVKLSQFTDNLKYVALENKENLPLGNIKQFDISDNLILISDMSICLLFDTSGHFISKIGNNGRGPGEYPYIINVSLGKNIKVYLSDTENLFEYNTDGSFVKKYKNVILNETYYIPSWFQIVDSLFFGHNPNSTGQLLYKALIVNKHGAVIHEYKNYILFKRSKRISSNLENHAHIYKFKDAIFYSELYNDTLFCLTDQYELIPKFTFKLGRFKEPLSEREKSNFDDHMSKYIYVYNAFQTENYLFIDCHFGNQFPAKRLTPLPTPIPTKDPIWYNTRSALGIYNKSTENIIFCKPTSTDNPLFTSGLYNDIDAGPRFFPSKQINDSTLAMWVKAKDLKDHIASEDFKNTVPKYPEKKKELEKLANSLNEFDNPLLMIVIFKNKKGLFK